MTAAALWGTLGIFARVLAEIGVRPLEMTSIRAAGAFVLLALWMARTPRKLAIRVRDLPFFLAYGVLGLTLFHFLYFAALDHTSIAVAVALLYTAPAFVLILSRIFFQEPIGRGNLGVLLLVLIGVFLVTGAARSLVTGGAPITMIALLLGLGSGLSYGLYTIFGKFALRRYEPDQTVFFSFLFGALVLGLVAPPWRPFIEYPSATVPLILLGLLITVIPYILYTAGLRHLAPGTASMLASIEPVVATLTGFSILGEDLGLDQLLGVIAIIGAALLLARPPVREESRYSSHSSHRTRPG